MIDLTNLFIKIGGSFAGLVIIGLFVVKALYSRKIYKELEGIRKCLEK